MLNIVIIGKNEGASVERMLASLLHINAKRIWVVDRTYDGTVKFLKSKDEKYVRTNPFLRGRQVSHARNLGLSLCDKDSDVLFLDGDRYPIDGTLNKLNTWNKDIALLLLQNDFRWQSNFNYDLVYGQVHNGFYSCGVFFKRGGINKILKAQNGELFRTDIQKKWGIEDVSLGDMCYHLKLTCNIYKDCILNGNMTQIQTMSPGLDNIKKRFEIRRKLNVLWD